MQRMPSMTYAAIQSQMMVEASTHVDALAVVVSALVGHVVDLEPFTAEHEVVDSISDFGREG